MDVQFDRSLTPVETSLPKVTGLLKPPAGKFTAESNAAGYLLSHQQNDSFVAVNRLLKAKCEVYWLKNMPSGHAGLGTGVVWVPATPAALPILRQAAAQLGIDVYGVSQAPKGDMLKLRPVRIGLFDQYGGLMPSGWDRWLFEQYEFPFEVVYPQTLDAGNLKDKFDVLVFTDGAYRKPGVGHGEGRYNRQPQPNEIPKEYRAWLGRISPEKTIPRLKEFVESGGSVVTIGGSTEIGRLLGLPVSDYLSPMGADGKPHPIPHEKYYIPGSLLKAKIDNTNPLAYGMLPEADFFFDNSPVFKFEPNAQLKQTSAVSWFEGTKPLVSGWAWGQQYLDGGIAVADSTAGKGQVFLLGPEVTFRAQPHGTFKLLFNGLYYGNAEPSPLQ